MRALTKSGKTLVVRSFYIDDPDMIFLAFLSVMVAAHTHAMASTLLLYFLFIKFRTRGSSV